MVLRLGRLARGLACALGKVTLPLVAIAVLGAPQAQARQSDIPPPKFVAPDVNGVDLIAGGLSITMPNNSIGTASGSLSNAKTYRTGVLPSATMNAYVQIGDDGQDFVTTLVLDGRSQTFKGAPGYGTQPKNDAVGRLSAVIGSSITYFAPDGRVVTFGWAKHNMGNEGVATGYIKRIDYPTGETITFNRGANIISNLGYVLMFKTDNEALDLDAGNLTQGNCSTSDCATQIQRFSSQTALGRDVQQSGVAGTFTVRTADGDGLRTYVTSVQGLFTGDEAFRVTSVIQGNSTWTYSYAFTQTSTFPDAVDGILTVTAKDPSNVRRIVKSRLSTGHVISDQEGITDADPNGRTTLYGYTLDGASESTRGFGKIAKVTMPRGDWFEYTLDDYNNVTRRAHYPVGWTSGAGYTEITAGYSCHAVTIPSTGIATNICTQPDWIKDENGQQTGQQTDFTYNANGLVETVTKPAGPNGFRPQTRYAYTQVRANHYNSVPNGDLIWRVQSTSSCRTQTACAGTADELVTEYAYESGTSSYHNARLISVTTRSGNATGAGAVSSTTTYAYNARGDVIETDGPLAGNVDLVQTRYDASRWVVGTVGADPDGASGSLLYRATKTSYRADGQVATSYAGVVADRSDAAYNGAFQIKSYVANEYDTNARVIARVSANGSGSSYALTETSYDSFGRVDCVAVRMDPSKFANRLGACSGGDNGAGKDADRITRTAYDKYGQIASVQSGLNVNPIFDRRTTYTANGKVETEKDGENNLTSYAYDGLDRLQFTYYPSATKGAGSVNGSDYDQYGYDAAGNVTYRRLRDNRTITSTYDNLGRLRTKAVAAADTAAVSYTYDYDNFDRPISTTDGTLVVSQQYDALGRMTSEISGVASDSSSLRTMAYEYDAAGRRTKLAWPDSFYVTYDYDNASALTAIRRAGSAAAGDKIAGFAYDDLGRRTSISRGGTAATTSYGYDAANLLLSSIGQAPTSAGDGVTYSFGYNAAGQVKTRTISNGLYAWNGAYAVNRPYTLNGLNQVANAGTSGQSGYTVYGYDGRGNLICTASAAPACTSPSVRYIYDAENRLRGTTAGAALVYDPLGRLYSSTTVGGTTTRYVYDGANLVGEYSTSSNVPLRRYVFGAGVDEPLARFINGGTTPEWLLADHQGSVIAILNSTGAVTNKNTYDEYGVPGSGNAGLFQYTGQAYLADLSLYHYKARAYSPTLGRFLQTDPTGYDDGLNWYAYVGNDPLNRSDPTGNQAAYPACKECMDKIASEASKPKFVTTYTKAEVNAVAGVGGKAGGGTYETRTLDGKFVETGAYARASVNAGVDIGAGAGGEVEVSAQKPSTSVSFGADGSVMGVSGAVQKGSFTTGYGVGPGATPVTGTIGMEVKVVRPMDQTVVNPSDTVQNFKRGFDTWTLGIKTQIGQAMCAVSVCR